MARRPCALCCSSVGIRIECFARSAVDWFNGSIATSVVEAFVARHPEAGRYAAFGDFAPWVLAVDRARYVEGFGVMSFVPGEAYRGAFT